MRREQKNLLKSNVNSKKMELKKKILIKGFADSFNAIRKKPIYFIASLIIDFLFLFIFSIVYYFFFEKIMDKIISLLMLTGKALQGVTQNEMSLNILANQQQMNSLIVGIGFWILGLAVLVYILYCTFQGTSWFFANKIFKSKLNYLKYIKRFFAVNTLWHIAFMIIAYFYVRALIFTNVLKISSNFETVRIFSLIILIILSYFAFISYVLIKKYGFIDSIKKSFSLGTKEFSTIVPMYILLILGFALIEVILRLLFMINTTLMIVVGMILTFPFIVYAKLVIISVIENLVKKSN